MREVPQRISLPEATATLALPPGREELAKAMHEFLVWIEYAKGLTLCQAFKPQYDWYMPAFANKENLAREFLGTWEAAALEPPNPASPK